MQLRDYPRPDRDNGRGMHWSASPYHATEVDEWMARLRALNIRWLKLLDDGGGSSVRLCGRLLAEGIMPVVRLYRPMPNPGHIGGQEEQTIRDLVKLGVRYIETNNEPDLQVEWNGLRPPDWLTVVADNWLYDAAKCLDAGALPAVPALSVGRTDDLVRAIIERGGTDALLAGAWIAVHNYALNHPLDYPDDDVNQRGTPLTPAEYAAEGTWAWDNVPMDTINAWRWQDKNPGDTILDDASCFRSFEFFNSLAVNALGVSLPMISTEGGVVVGWREDRRYVWVTAQRHMERSVATFSYMQTSAPDYYFALCPWLFANFDLGHLNPGWESQAWYGNWWNEQFNLRGKLPAVDAVAAMPTLSRLETGGPHHSVVQGDIAALRGVSALRVLLTSEGYSSACTTDADGRFRFIGLGPGTYTLQAGGMIKAGLTLDGTNTLSLPGLRPPLPAAPELEWDRRLSDLRVSVTPASAAAGATIWRLARAAVLDRTQTGANAAVSFDVEDELSRPIAGQEVVLAWPSDMARKSSEQAERPAHGAAFPISGAYKPSDGPGPYSAWVDGLPSDRVSGMGLPLGQAVEFVLSFRRGPAPGASGSRIEGTISGAKGATAVTLRLPDGRTLVQHTDSAGRFGFQNLGPGLYGIDVAGQGTAGRDLPLDGANLLLFDYALPDRLSTIRGSVIGGQPGLDVTLRAESGDVRRTTVGQAGVYAFTLLPAGTYSLTVAGQTVTGLIVDGIASLQVRAIDVRPRRSTIGGIVRGRQGQPLSGAVVTLNGPEGSGAETRRATAAQDGSFRFSDILAGWYTLASLEVSRRLQVDGLTAATADLEVATESGSRIALVLLFGLPGTPGVVADLRLARGYIARFAPAVSFRVEEAAQARQVLIVGDRQAVSEADEQELRGAGVNVARVGGTPYAVEDGLARLVAAGTPLPKGRSAVTVSVRRPDDVP